MMPRRKSKRLEFGGSDVRKTKMKELLRKERWNKEAVIVLNEIGFEGKHLSKSVQKVDWSKLPKNVTVTETRVHEELLEKCTTHVARFHATCIGAVNSDCVFIMVEQKVWEKRI